MYMQPYFLFVDFLKQIPCQFEPKNLNMQRFIDDLDS